MLTERARRKQQASSSNSGRVLRLLSQRLKVEVPGFETVALKTRTSDQRKEETSAQKAFFFSGSVLLVSGRQQSVMWAPPVVDMESPSAPAVLAKVSALLPVWLFSLGLVRAVCYELDV